MKVLIESIYDRDDVCPVYDEPGACPKCGQPMRAIRLYHADTRTLRGATTRTYRGGRWEQSTPVTTYYDNIRPCALGFCEACYREEEERLQAEKGKTPPSPVKWAVGAGLGAVGLVLIVRSMILNEHEVNTLLKLAFAAFGVGLYLFFKNIGGYMKQRKEYLRYKSGARDYSPMSESAVASVLTTRTPGEAYLTEQALREMQAKNNPLNML